MTDKYKELREAIGAINDAKTIDKKTGALEAFEMNALPWVVSGLLSERDAMLEALRHIECEPINAEYMARAVIAAHEAKWGAK